MLKGVEAAESAGLHVKINMVRNLRHFFQRGEVTDQELRTLHGIITELVRRRNIGSR